MKITDLIQPPSLADQLKGNAQRALKEHVDENIKQQKEQSANNSIQETQNKINLLA